MELEHKAYWALKNLNFDMQLAGEKRMLQLDELENSDFFLMRMLSSTRKRQRNGMIKTFNLESLRWGNESYYSTQG